MKRSELFFVLAGCVTPLLAQSSKNADYQLALGDHKGQLRWSVEGSTVVEKSAKPDGLEVNLRGRDSTGRVSFLGVLFVLHDGTSSGSEACRDAGLAQEKKTNPTLKILNTTEISRPGGLPVAIATYTVAATDGSLEYRARAFVASGDLCGDLAFSSSQPISDEDEDLRKVFRVFKLDPNYVPQFADVTFYAQSLFQSHQYKAAGSAFERALTMVPPNGAPFKSATAARRAMRDQAGMSYALSGELAKAQKILEKAIDVDPDYPLYYYHVACVEAGEKKLADAKTHLQQAFDKNMTMVPHEIIPDPTSDDFFLPYKSDKEFWDFLEHLQGGK